MDVNIVVYLFIQGRHSDSAGHLFDRDANWILPDLWIHEMTNVVSTYIKQDGMSTNNGEKILKSPRSDEKTLKSPRSDENCTLVEK